MGHAAGAGLARQLRCLGLLAVAGVAAWAQSPPRLDIARAGAAQVRLTWTHAPDLVLEETSSLTPPVNWLLVPEPPDMTGVLATQVVSAGTGTRSFHLRETPGAFLTRIVETSPAAGETRVAVTRETILRFSRPLRPRSRCKPAPPTSASKPASTCV